MKKVKQIIWSAFFLLPVLFLQAQVDPCGPLCPDVLTDLTACPSEKQFGYIAHLCKADFEWTLPSGSSALVVGNNHSTIVQASPGIYSVTMTDAFGCTDEHKYEVIEDCCKCSPPTGLDCDYNANGVDLTWEDVPGAEGYIITVIFQDSDCGCNLSGNETTIVSELVIDPEFQVTNTDLADFDFCFSWTVSTVCSEELVSDPSEEICFSGGQDCFPKNGLLDDREKERQYRMNSPNQFSAKIYPNPSSGQFNFNVVLEERTDLTITVFDVNGKLVDAINEKALTPGVYQKVWFAEEPLSNGIYFVEFKTKNRLVNEMIILNRD